MAELGVQIIICDRRMFQQTLRQALEAPGHMHTQVRIQQHAAVEQYKSMSSLKP